MKENAVPRALALVLLLVSLAMFIPLGTAIAGMVRGQEVAATAWAVPLVILATGFALMTFLPRMQAATPQLFMLAMALWVIAAGYVLFSL